MAQNEISLLEGADRLAAEPEPMILLVGPATMSQRDADIVNIGMERRGSLNRVRWVADPLSRFGVIRTVS